MPICYRRRGIIGFKMVTTSVHKSLLLCHLRTNSASSQLETGKSFYVKPVLCCDTFFFFLAPSCVGSYQVLVWLVSCHPSLFFPDLLCSDAWTVICHSEDQRRVAMTFLPTVLHSAGGDVRDESDL